MRKQLAGAVIGLLAWTISASLAEARITQIEILKSEPAYSGAAFGDVGRYERLVGRVAGELDPADPANAIIQDINLAPRNARGMVQYSTEIELLKPARHRARQSHPVVRGQQPRQQARAERLQRRRRRNVGRAQRPDLARRRLADAAGLHDGLVRLGDGRAAGHEPHPHAAHRRAQSRRIADHRHRASRNHRAGADRRACRSASSQQIQNYPARQLRQLSHREPRQSDARRRTAFCQR